MSSPQSSMNTARGLRPRLRAGLILLALGAATLAGGCRTMSPAFVGIPTTESGASIKRYERIPERDFFNHFTRTAYKKPNASFWADPGTPRATIVEQWGRPDFIRKPFISMYGEQVLEWLYLDQGLLFQFVADELVFEGPVTDVERVLLARGYPDQSKVIQSDSSIVQVFVYNAIFAPILDEFHFVNGQLTQFKEGN